MNDENTCGEGSVALPRVLSRSQLQKQVTDFTAQRLAISEVLRAIIRSPHDLQPILQTIVENAVQLCRAEGGIFRVAEEMGFRLVAYKMNSPTLEGYSPPMFRERGSFVGRLYESKSPVHIPTLTLKSMLRERLTNWLSKQNMAFGRSPSSRCSVKTS